MIFTAGVIGWDENEQFVSDDFVDQFRLVLRGTLSILAQDDAGPEHVVRMTWYIVDRDEYASRIKEVGTVYRELMGEHYPCMTVVQVGGLMEQRAQIEIETTAVVPE